MTSIFIYGTTQEELSVITINKSNVTNPKYINITSPEIWNKRSKVDIRIQVFNQEDELYEPDNIIFESKEKGILIEKSEFNEENETIITFFVSNTAEEGNTSIKITIVDNRDLEEEILFKIGGKIDIGTEDSYEKKLRRFMIIAGILVALIFLFIFVVLAIQSWKNKPKETAFV